MEVGRPVVEKNTDKLWLTVGAVIVGAVMIFTYKDEVGAMSEKILSKFNVSIADVFDDSDDDGGSELVLSDSKVSYSSSWNMMMGQWLSGGDDGSSYTTDINKFTKKGNTYEATITVDASDFKLMDGSDYFSFTMESRRGLQLELGEKDKEAIDLESGESNLSDYGDGTYQVERYTTYITNESGDVNESDSSSYLSISSKDQSAKTVFPVHMKDGSTIDFVVNYKFKGSPVDVLSFNQNYDFDLKGKLTARSAADDSVIGAPIDLSSAKKTESMENQYKYITYEVGIDLPRKDMDLDTGSGVNISLSDASIKVDSERDFNIMDMASAGFTYTSGRMGIDDVSGMFVHESTQNDEQLTYTVLSANNNQIMRIRFKPTIVD